MPVADLAGLTVAYDAYKKSLGGKAAPTLDGTTGGAGAWAGGSTAGTSPPPPHPVIPEAAATKPH